jgi:hypothetical protein
MTRQLGRGDELPRRIIRSTGKSSFSAKSIVPRLDLDLAIASEGILNDLLPPREDDKVTGELSSRFITHFRTQLSSENYQPQVAKFVRVPKAGFTSRPAAALTLRDRVLYEALVRCLTEGLHAYLVPQDVVLWPREKTQRKEWQAFQRAPLAGAATHVIKADVSGFYDSVDHGLLADQLIYATGEVEVVACLIDFLGEIMGSIRGLPQGLPPSDVLATAYLQPIDAAMIREGFSYWRHGDDIRVATQSFSRAQEAIAVFEHELRRQSLLVNSAKCAILSRSGYADEFASWDKTRKETVEALVQARISTLEGDSDALLEAMKSAELDDQVGWDLFYHGTISFGDVIEQIREHLIPTDLEVAARVFAETIDRSPDKADGLPKEQFHQRLVFSLTRLAAGKIPIAIAYASTLMAKFAEKTELVCGYLSAVIGTNSSAVVAQLADLLKSDVYATGWQRAWWIRTLLPGMAAADETLLEVLKGIVGSDAHDWFERVEALKALGAGGQLDESMARHAWKAAPDVYRPDVLAAISRASGQEWASRFLSVAHLDPVHKVIATHARVQS